MVLMAAASTLLLAQRGQAPLGAQLPYKDIYFEERPNGLVFGNSKLRLEIGKTKGEWVSLAATGIPGSLISPTEQPAAVDFRIDDTWMVERYGASYLRHSGSVDAKRDAVSLCVVLGVAPPSRPPLIPERWSTRAGQARPSAYEYELTSCYTLFAGERRLERSASVTRLGGADILASTYSRMQGFLFQLPNAVVADSSECTIENPGPLFLNSYIPPNTPYKVLQDKFYNLGSSPDLTLGIVAIVNKTRNATLATWMDTKAEVAYHSYLSGNGDRLTILQHDFRVERMARGGKVASDAQRIELVEGLLPEALGRYRQMASHTMPIAAQTPRWTREMVLLEVLPSYFPGGLTELTRKLPFYKQVGFNTIYLMPHWLGGYSPIDPFTLDPAIGTPEDLKEMVRTAHSLGLRVLFDMVIHGFNPSSPIVRSHPEFFQKDEQGLIVLHQTWGSMSTDAASPAYQQYMVDLVLHDIRTYDIDGYRVDANAYKMANWDPKIPYSPGYSGAATRQLVARMYEAMRVLKPESVILSELFGPVWHSISNLVHDNMTQGSIALLEMMEKNEIQPVQYKEHLARIMDALPDGAVRVRFGRNHDTSWFYHFPGYTPRFMAMEAIHALFGVPEVFAGDRANPPHPDDDPLVFEYYRKLFEARKQFPELATGDVLLRDVDCDNPRLFTGVRQLNGRRVVVAISLSDQEEKTVLTIPARSGSAAALELVDPISGETVSAQQSVTTAGGMSLKLKPFQVLIGRL